MLLSRWGFLTCILTVTSTSPTPTASPTPTSFHPSLLLRGQPTTTSAVSTTAIEFISTQYITIGGPASQIITIAIPTCSQTIIPDKNGYVPPGTCNALWNYYPSFTAAFIFAILFCILTVVHIYQAASQKKKFCWVVIMAALWETIAFTFRTISTRHQQNVGIYLVFQIFILLAPLCEYYHLSRLDLIAH
jgi:hypothetical protein